MWHALGVANIWVIDPLLHGACECRRDGWQPVQDAHAEIHAVGVAGDAIIATALASTLPRHAGHGGCPGLLPKVRTIAQTAQRTASYDLTSGLGGYRTAA